MPRNSRTKAISRRKVEPNPVTPGGRPVGPTHQRDLRSWKIQAARAASVTPRSLFGGGE